MYTTEKAYRESYTEAGHMVHCGWHVLVDGEWAQTYRTKGEAVAAIARMEAAAIISNVPHTDADLNAAGILPEGARA